MKSCSGISPPDCNRPTANSPPAIRAKPASASRCTRSTAARIFSNPIRRNGWARSLGDRSISLRRTFSVSQKRSICRARTLCLIRSKQTTSLRRGSRQTRTKCVWKTSPPGWPIPSTTASRKNFVASRWKIFASILKTATATGPTRKKTDTPRPLPKKWPRAC